MTNEYNYIQQLPERLQEYILQKHIENQRMKERGPLAVEGAARKQRTKLDLANQIARIGSQASSDLASSFNPKARSYYDPKERAEYVARIFDEPKQAIEGMEDRQFKLYQYLADAQAKRAAAGLKGDLAERGLKFKEEEAERKREFEREEAEKQRKFKADESAKDRAAREARERAKSKEKGAKEKKFSQNERQSAGYAVRMEAAHKNLESMLNSGYDPTSYSKWVRGLGLGKIRPGMSDADRKFESIMRDFITANLREESGAAIPQSEIEEEMQKYIPVEGDGPETIATKAAARKRAIENMKFKAGGAYGARANATKKDKQSGSGSGKRALVEKDLEMAKQRGDTERVKRLERLLDAMNKKGK